LKDVKCHKDLENALVHVFGKVMTKGRI